MFTRSAQTIRASTLFRRHFSHQLQRDVDILLLKQGDGVALYIVVDSVRDNRKRQVDIIAECGVRKNSVSIYLTNKKIITADSDALEAELKSVFQNNEKNDDKN